MTTKTIKVGKSFTAIVDEQDYEIVSARLWFSSRKLHCRYARTVLEDGRTLSMHRLILGTNSTLDVDHINGNGLDNRRENLRVCTRSENLQNSRKHCKSSSRFKGVYWEPRRKRWVAQIRHNKVKKYLGSFGSEVDAAAAYDSAAKNLFGDFANANS